MGRVRSGSCEFPSLPLPPFLPCDLRAALVHVQVAGFAWLGRVCCSGQLFLLFSEEKSSRLDCNEHRLDADFRTFPSRPAATEVMADSLASAYCPVPCAHRKCQRNTMFRVWCPYKMMCSMPILLFFFNYYF